MTFSKVLKQRAAIFLKNEGTIVFETEIEKI